MLTTDQPATVYMTYSLWVARCPQPWCVGIDHYGPGPNTGRIGGLGETQFCCPRCGTVATAAWPESLDDLLHVLMQRPMPETRNWEPGETLQDLIAENAIHGIGREELATTGFRIASDRFADRFVLTGRTLLAIGGN